MVVVIVVLKGDGRNREAGAYLDELGRAEAVEDVGLYVCSSK